MNTKCATAESRISSDNNGKGSVAFRPLVRTPDSKEPKTGPKNQPYT